ncbi:MAG TPA: hypothetical protein VFR94_21830 [Nitrososphaeraceae archaeon]|nr:hypothetical protein [Nitrososphaeraceae archaeon]
MHDRQIAISPWKFLIVLPPLLLSSYFLLVISLVIESTTLLYDAGSEHKIMEGYGRIANNQIINNGSISWIQSGLWYLTASYNDTDKTKNAYFYTDFKMVRPDGSSLHEHFIKDFKSTNVLVEKEKIVVDGIADIYSGDSIDYKEVPIAVYLTNNTVLVLTIDMDKTQKHFASFNANPMLGVLIESRDLGHK